MFWAENPRVDVFRKKCLSYSFTHEIYGKNAYHTKLIQNLKMVLKILMNFFALYASFEVFWSFKKDLKFSFKKCISCNFYA